MSIATKVSQQKMAAAQAAIKAVPPADRFRRCFGVAIGITPEETIEVGDSWFLPAAAVHWIASKDVPQLVHGRPRSWQNGRISKGITRIEDGKVLIDLRDKASTFEKLRNEEIDHDAQLFSAAAEMSHRMVRHASRQDRPVHPSKWMPQPWLGYDENTVRDLFAAAFNNWTRQPVLNCPSCNTDVLLQVVRKAAKFMPSGEFISVCPSCGARHKYEPEAVRNRLKPKAVMPAAFKAFLDDVARGLPLYAPGTLRYRSAELGSQVVHTFDVAGLSDQITLCLPADAIIHVKVGETIEPGKLIAECMDVLPPSSWLKLSPEGRRQELDEVLNVAHLHTLTWAWFQCQGLVIPKFRNQVFYEAKYVNQAGHLIWNMTPTSRYLDGTQDLIVGPPVPISSWDHLRHQLAGVTIDASVLV